MKFLSALGHLVDIVERNIKNYRAKDIPTKKNLEGMR